MLQMQNIKNNKSRKGFKMGYGEEVGRLVIPMYGDEDLLERVEGAFTEYSFGAVDVDPCWHGGTIVISSTELNTDSLREILLDNGIEIPEHDDY